MKLFNKQTIALLICVITINILCITSVSYAYFTARIEGNDKAEDMVINAGTMIITYTDTDNNEISLKNALPGDSVTKTFKVENEGSLTAKYNIKLNILNTDNNFVDMNDLKITLEKKSSKEETFTTVIDGKIVPTDSGYILVNQSFDSGAIDTYKLTIAFEKDESDQNDNADKDLNLTVVVDSVQNAQLVSGY